MARKRYISSDMSTDSRLALLAENNTLAALAWPWLVTCFDDWGRMGADPVEVKLTIFPAFSFTVSQVREILEFIAKSGLAHMYEVDGKRYLAIEPAKWFKYQTYIPPERRSKMASKYPEPPSPPWEIGEKRQTSAINANLQQEVAQSVLSLSLSQSLSHSLSNDNDRGNNPVDNVDNLEPWKEVLNHWLSVSGKLEVNLTPNDTKAAMDMVGIASGDIPCIIRGIDKMIAKQGKPQNGLKYYINPVSEEVALRDVTSSAVTIPVVPSRTRGRKQSSIPGANRNPQDAKYYADYAKLEEQLLNAEDDDDERGSA